MRASAVHTGECSRLAPSPTGALHLGNARTFLVNWALARQRGWRLILRIEDLDTPRVKAGSTEAIMDTLAWLGIEWDTPSSDVLVQSRDLEPYRVAMRLLASRGLVYPCTLSRADIEAAASAPQQGAHEVRFPLHLRPELREHDFDKVEAEGAGGGETNWRFAVPTPPGGEIEFADAFAGRQSFDVSSIVGDFVVWTKRGQPAYQLAVVVDDHRQGVTQVVRGADLLDSGARQLLLYRALGYTQASGAGEPTYTHLPLVLGPDGKRLAKRHGDTRVDAYRRLGAPAEALIGLAAWWSGASGPRPPRAPMSAREFLDRFKLSTMSPRPVTFTPEDDQWLVSQARRSPT